MAKSKVKLEFEELKKFKRQLEEVTDPKGVDQFLSDCSKELAARLLAKVIKRTPVGKYSKESGKTGGTLRRGWTAGKDRNDVVTYANSLPINKIGDQYVIKIINPVEYASYVEFGHRTRDHKGWVEGKFMLTISEDKVRKLAPKALEKRLYTYLKRCLQ